MIATSIVLPSSSALVPRTRFLICVVGIHDNMYNKYMFTNEENAWVSPIYDVVEGCWVSTTWDDVLTSSTLDGRVRCGYDYEEGSYYMVVQFRLY